MKNKNLYQDLKIYKQNNQQEDSQVLCILEDESDYTSGCFTWGVTPYETYKSVIKHIKGTHKRFIVAGCSIGWMNFYWNEENPNIQTIGFDLHETRVAYANFIIKKHDLSNVDIYKKDILDFEFKKGDLVWLSNLMFSDEVNKKLFDKLIQLDLPIISYRSIPDPKVLKIEGKVSWTSRQPFFIRNE